MPLAASPDFALDFLTQLALVSGGTVILVDGATKNAFYMRELPSLTGESPVKAVFAQEYGGANDVHTDGRLGGAGVSVICRGKNYTEAYELAKHVHDKMDLTGEFTANGHRYVDCRANNTGPEHLEVEQGSQHESFIESFTLTYEQLFV